MRWIPVVALTCMVCLAGTMVLAQPARADDAPLSIRNTDPLAGLFGLPRPRGGRVLASGSEWVFGTDYGNSFSSSRQGNTEVFLDVETAVLAVQTRRALADGWEWGAEVPYLVHRDSDLDSFIDEFHQFFGLPEGGRDMAPTGRLDVLVRVDNEVFVDFDDTERGIGDVRLWLGRSLYDAGRRSGALRASLKLPTGSADKLTGSEATDVALWWEHDEQAVAGLDRLGLSLMVGGAYLGEGDIAPRAQNRWVPVGSLGLRFRLWDRVTLKLQADAHGAPWDADVGELADHGLQGTIGGRVRISDRLWLDLGVVENLESRSSPDAVFLLQLGGRW